MEVLYTKSDNSVEGELSLEGKNYTPGTRGLCICKLTQEKGVLICCAILSIGFVIFVALLSQSLINDSAMSTRINLMNAHLSQKLLNGGLTEKGNLSSVQDELVELRRENIKIAKDVVQMLGGLTEKGNLSSVRDELAELKRENIKISKDVVQMLGGLNNLTGALMANRNLTSEPEELAELKRENRIVLDELAEVKKGNARIAKDVIQVQEKLSNLTDFFCLSCPPNWQHFDRNCYFFSTLRGSWTSAKQSCEAEGAHLVIINNKAELNFLAGQMINDQVAWIGLNDKVTEGKWVWVDGTPLSLAFWHSGEPNDAGKGGEDCATLLFDGLWNDARCPNNDFWICEQKC